MPWEKSLNSDISTVFAGYLSAVVMKDDVSSGWCLFVQLWSSSHTYIVENVHDNNICLYPFIMLVVDLLLPVNALFPIAVSKIFYIRDTYFLYSVYFILLIVHSIKNSKNISFTKHAFYPVTYNII